MSSVLGLLDYIDNGVFQSGGIMGYFWGYEMGFVLLLPYAAVVADGRTRLGYSQLVFLSGYFWANNARITVSQGVD